ncbi:hypothetical protein GOM73_10910 [Cutibacterium acnes]|nr:hypothetical protein [Cutibacterium acnes]
MSRIQTRLDQGWVGHVSDDLDEVFALAKKHIDEHTPISIAYHGNIVDLLKYAVDNNINIPLLSDQTSCHAAYDGGYCPQGLTFEQRTELLARDRDEYARRVNESLRTHYELIRTLTDRGTYFFDYGNAFMATVFESGVTEIAHAVGIIAEVDMSRIQTRLDQGWVGHVSDDLDEVFALAKKHIDEHTPISIAYHGNIVDLLKYAVDNNINIPLLSDQTSCHAAYDGGYCPQGLTFEQRTELLARDRDEYARRVNESLRTHYELIRTLTDRGTYFFDYGNAFMATVFESGVTEIAKDGDARNGFIWPSYVEDIMGPELFDYGYGPFRWVCLSGKREDLIATDHAAMDCIDPNRRGQDRDNYIWIRDAEANNLVVGTQARILYQDAQGRMDIALRFNKMVRDGEIGPVMLGRDHHDVSGTDSPFRETANIKDGSNVMADMATQCFAGNAARGMSLVTLHNGGGTGIGNAINGGFGLVLDGSERVDNVIRSSLLWDVMCGVARRGWARNAHSIETATEFNHEHNDAQITLPYLVDDALIDGLVK